MITGVDPLHTAPAPHQDAVPRPLMRRPSMAGTTTRLLLIGLIALALVPPLAIALGGVVLERHEARATAASLAWTIDQQRLGADRTAVDSLLRADAAQARQWREALASDGSVIAEAGQGNDRHSLLLSATVATMQPGPVAAVRVREPVVEVLLATAIAALFSLAAAGLIWMLVVRRSVGALRKAEGRLRTITVIDPLTGLLNRAGLRQRLQRGLDAERNAATRRVGVLLIDMDRFRLINESLGQRAGDELLRAVAERIRGVLRNGDAAARLGGDQFVVYTPTLAGAQAAAVMARNLLRAIEPALVIAQRQTQVSVSIGIALAGNGAQTDAVSADQLLAHADAAMRAAKSGGGGRYRVFEASMLVNTQKQLELDMALRRALQAGEFELAFQPIMDADGLSIGAVEALLRWNDPSRGVVSPGEFIPVLEQTGLIVPVGQWVLREACKRVQGWMTQGAAPVTLSVNVSPIQFAEPDFVRHVFNAIEATGFPAKQLQLEVTEGLLLDPTPDSLRKMDALVDAGVRLAVDDFGMGYSSLAYLKRFRLHSLKIDRMFVRDVPKLRQDTAIVRAIVELAHALELHVTAEGVETAEQHEALRALGCDSMQGFLFARPMPADAMRDRLVLDEALGLTEPARADWSTTMAAGLDVGLPA
jgi:diguanylate cyclase (GGDEF)-like protein